MPVNGKCAMHSWTEYQQRAATSDEILQWWTSCSTAGIAIVTGQISHVVALDVDGRLGAATLARLEDMQAAGQRARVGRGLRSAARRATA